MPHAAVNIRRAARRHQYHSTWPGDICRDPKPRASLQRTVSVPAACRLSHGDVLQVDSSVAIFQAEALLRAVPGDPRSDAEHGSQCRTELFRIGIFLTLHLSSGQWKHAKETCYGRGTPN